MGILTADQITRLSPPYRLALIGELWDSLSQVDLMLSGPQQSELEQRLARFDHDREGEVDWEELKAELATRAP